VTGKPTTPNEIISVDNANIIDFLSSLASVLNEEKYTSDRDSENFRLTISSINMSTSSNDDSLLNCLFNEGDRISLSLKEILGEEGFYTSLLSNSLCANTDLIIKSLSSLGEEMIKAAKLSFNRKVTISNSAASRDVTLASQFLENLISKIDYSIEKIENTSSQILYAIPLTTKLESTVDLLSKALDAKKVIYTETPLEEFQVNVKTLLETIASLISNLTKISNSLCLSEGNSKDQLSLSSQILLAKLDEIHSLYKGFLPSFNSFDLQRSAIMARFAEANESVRLFSEKLNSHIKKVGTNQPQKGLYEKQKRLIRLELLQKNVPFGACEEATDNLDQYLIKNDITIEKIIPQELKKISEHLEFLDLENFEVSSRELAFGETSRKSRILTNLTEFSGKFSKHLGQIGIIICVLIGGFGSGCGVKGDPKPVSEVIRPDVPFKSKTTGQKQRLDLAPKEIIKKSEQS
jgi:hypothetical protein